MKQWITRFFNWSEYVKLGGAKRHSHWRYVRNAFVKKHPLCEVCGTKKSLEVHHCTPFHIDPTLELEETNLITLCTPHHYLVGHLMSWRSYNKEVRVDALYFKNKITNRP